MSISESLSRNKCKEPDTIPAFLHYFFFHHLIILHSLFFRNDSLLLVEEISTFFSFSTNRAILSSMIFWTSSLSMADCFSLRLSLISSFILKESMQIISPFYSLQIYEQTVLQASQFRNIKY